MLYWYVCVGIPGDVCLCFPGRCARDGVPPLWRVQTAGREGENERGGDVCAAERGRVS